MFIIIYKDGSVRQGARNTIWDNNYLMLIDTTRKVKAIKSFRVTPVQRAPEWESFDNITDPQNILYVSDELDVFLGPLYKGDLKDRESGECILLMKLSDNKIFTNGKWKNIILDEKKEEEEK